VSLVVGEDRSEHAVERRQLGVRRDEHGTRRAVQVPPGRRADEPHRLGEVRRPTRGDGHSGGVQSLTQRRGHHGQVDLECLFTTDHLCGCRVVTHCTMILWMSVHSQRCRTVEMTEGFCVTALCGRAVVR
jgi:hypothetical protein